MPSSEVTTNPEDGARARFEATIAGLGLPFGREASVKLVPGGLRSGRVLVGCRAAALSPHALREACRALGMPAVHEALLAQGHPRASVVLFGLEPGDTDCMFKVYLEFWDQVRRQVRATGSRAPQLLHLGVKWQADRPERHAVARYLCHPLLSPADAAARIVHVMTGCTPAFTAVSTGLVGLAARRAPQESFLYLEVEEAGTPRQSYDINLYKAGLTLADAMPAIGTAGALLGVDPGALQAAFGPHVGRPLGHISAGLGRDGRAFMTWYWEVEALP